MNVLMTSTSYPSNATDWRGVFIKHLVAALATQVQLQLWAPPGDLPPSVTYACQPAEAAWLHTLMAQGGIAHLLRKGGLSRFTAPIKLLWLLRKAYQRHSPQVHLIHVNWLQNALPLLTLHLPLTTHHSSSPPALISVLGRDLGLLSLPGMTTALRQVFKQRPCLLAPNADWMVTPLTQRFGDIAQIIPIPFGIDATWYHLPRLPPEKPYQWLVVSRLTHAKLGPLFDWGKEIFQAGEHELHLFGPRQESIDIPTWVHYHGATHPQDLQEHWFPHATGLITLSQHDEGRPQILLEAMAASLPILASHLPAHNNFITHQQTGWLTSSQADFITGLHWLTNPKHHHAIAQQARAWATQQIGTWADCAQRYLAAYQRLGVETSR